MKRNIVGLFISLILILTIPPSSGYVLIESSNLLNSLDGKILYVDGYPYAENITG